MCIRDRQKNLHLTDKLTMEFHGDAFNLFNTPEFTNPDGGLHDGNFAQIGGTQLYTCLLYTSRCV